VYFIAPYTMPSFKYAVTNTTQFWQLAYHHWSQFCLTHVHRKMSLQDNAVILLIYMVQRKMAMHVSHNYNSNLKKRRGWHLLPSTWLVPGQCVCQSGRYSQEIIPLCNKHPSFIQGTSITSVVYFMNLFISFQHPTWNTNLLADHASSTR